MKNFLLLLTFGFASNSFSQVPYTLPINGLVGWWPFTGNTSDYSEHDLNGFNNGATLVNDRCNNPTDAFSFNGSSNYISVAGDSLLSLTTGLSISCWALIDNTSSTMDLVSRERNGSGGVSYHLEYNTPVGSNGFSLGVNNDPGGCTSCNLSVLSPSVATGTWQNVIGTWDGTNLKIYINGSLASSSNGTLSNGDILLTPPSSVDLFFGKQLTSASPNNYLSGKLDDIGIWNRALSLSEVVSVYNTSCPTEGVGIQAINANPNLRINPNPVHSTLWLDFDNINLTSMYTLKITNILGETIFTQPINQKEYSLNATSLGEYGMYIAYLLDANQSIVDTKKIIYE